jgi:predicted nucleotidyltransferase
MKGHNKTPQRHQAALNGLVAQLQEDRYVLAAILFGSLARGEAWEKSDIDLVAVLRDAVDRKRYGYWLLENGVSIWLEPIPR